MFRGRELIPEFVSKWILTGISWLVCYETAAGDQLRSVMARFFPYVAHVLGCTICFGWESLLTCILTLFSCLKECQLEISVTNNGKL